MPLTQDDLAGLAGATRSTVNRILNSEVKRGSVSLLQRRLTIGYSRAYISLLVLKQGALLAVLGFVPATLLACGLYALVRSVANVPTVIRAFSQAWDLTFRNGVCDHALKELCRVYVSKSIDCEY